MVQIIQFTCTCPAVCRLYLFTVAVISLLPQDFQTHVQRDHYHKVGLSSATIASANREVERVIEATKKSTGLTGCSLSRTSPLPHAMLVGVRSPERWVAVEVLTARNFVSGQTVRSLRFYERSLCVLPSFTQSVDHRVHDKTVQQFSYVSNHQCFRGQASLRLHKKSPSLSNRKNSL